jgi:hypothetical protein
LSATAEPPRYRLYVLSQSITLGTYQLPTWNVLVLVTCEDDDNNLHPCTPNCDTCSITTCEDYDSSVSYTYDSSCTWEPGCKRYQQMPSEGFLERPAQRCQNGRRGALDCSMYGIAQMYPPFVSRLGDKADVARNTFEFRDSSTLERLRAALVLAVALRLQLFFA